MWIDKSEINPNSVSHELSSNMNPISYHPGTHAFENISAKTLGLLQTKSSQ